MINSTTRPGLDKGHNLIPGGHEIGAAMLGHHDSAAGGAEPSASWSTYCCRSQEVHTLQGCRCKITMYQSLFRQ